jgi:CheY-like chemotaxis protein
MKLKNILLAEDSPMDVELTLEALQEHHNISVVEDGEAALDYLYRRGAYAGREPGNPDLILLDLKLPKLNGLQVLEQIKKCELLRTVPVVVLTSSKEQPDLRTAYDLGANAYVVKPVVFDQFMEAVRQIGKFWAGLNETPPRGVGEAPPPGAGPA